VLCTKRAWLCETSTQQSHLKLTTDLTQLMVSCDLSVQADRVYPSLDWFATSKFTIFSRNLCMYRIAGRLGRDKVWQIYSFQTFGEKKFGE